MQVAQIEASRKLELSTQDYSLDMEMSNMGLMLNLYLIGTVVPVICLQDRNDDHHDESVPQLIMHKAFYMLVLIEK